MRGQNRGILGGDLLRDGGRRLVKLRGGTRLGLLLQGT